jgi:monoamine oxidase
VDVLNAARRLAVGDVVRLTLRFDQPLWATHDRLSKAAFVHAPAEPFPAWWPRGPLLTAWAGGAQTKRLQGLDRQQLASTALDTLARIMSTDRAQLERRLGAIHFHDWIGDPFSRGAYSYVPAGALDAAEVIARPVENTLFFAGEAVDCEGHWGTVHGAIRSGERAANAVLRTS